MYTDYNTTETHRSHRAQEIDLRVREMDKKFALMNLGNRGELSGSAGNILSRTAKRLASLLAGLF